MAGKLYVLVRSLGRKCGMAEYAGFLARRLHGALIASPDQLPIADPEHPDIVLVQLEYGLYGGAVSQMINELMAVEIRGHIAVGDYASEPIDARGWSRILPRYCVFGPKYAEPGSFLLPLATCDPLTTHDPGPPAELKLGTFGFAAPAKRHEEVIKLAIRLDLPALIISTVPNPWPGFEGSAIEQVPGSCLTLYRRLAMEHPNIEIVHEGYLSTEEVLSRLRECSHLVSAMEDMTANWGPSGSLRTMAVAGRPLIATRSLRASEVGATLVGTLDEVDIPFLMKHRAPVRTLDVDDGLWAYQNLLHWLRVSIKAGKPIRRLN